MIKKLIVAVMLIATLGIGSVVYGQDTIPTQKRLAGTRGKGRPRAQRHRRGNRGAIKRGINLDSYASTASGHRRGNSGAIIGGYRHGPTGVHHRYLLKDYNRHKQRHRHR